MAGIPKHKVPLVSVTGYHFCVEGRTIWKSKHYCWGAKWATILITKLLCPLFQHSDQVTDSKCWPNMYVYPMWITIKIGDQIKAINIHIGESWNQHENCGITRNFTSFQIRMDSQSIYTLTSKFHSSFLSHSCSESHFYL